MFPMRGILGQAPGYGGGVRFQQGGGGGGYASDAGNSYGSNQMTTGGGGYGNNQMADSYVSNQMSGNYGNSQMSDNYGGDQMSGNYGGNQMSDNYGSNQMSGNYGGNQMSDNYGSNQASGNYGGNQMSGSYGNNQMRSTNFGNNQTRSNTFGNNQASGNFGGNQTKGNFGSNQASGNFGSNQLPTGNFGGNQMSGNFGGNQSPGNFGGNQMSGNLGGNQRSGNFGGNQMRSSNFGSNQMSDNTGGNQMSGSFGGNQSRSGNFGGNQARPGNFGKSRMGGKQMQQFSPSISFPEQPMNLFDRDFDMPPFLPVRMPRPLMETPARGFLVSGRNKRFFEEDIFYPAKRPRPNPVAHVLPPKVKNNFLVPVSEGTEKITMDIWNYFLSAKMEDADVKRKLRLRKCIMAVVGNAFPNCSLFIVGSSMTGFATKGSDVDMCLMISQEEIDQRRDASIILHSISKALRQCTCFNYREVIKAKVPILKFFDKISGVECDLNVNNLVGVRNTHLMRFYAYMDWRVRPLMLFIKKWARYHDINDASKQTISSYSLTLMLIHYLQVGVDPPVLPCLQETKPELFDPKLDVRQLSLNFEPYLDFVSENRATLGELFLGFLDYYANHFTFDDKIISVRLGRVLSFDEVSTPGNSMQWKHLNIEEPFEKTNTARSVYDKFIFMRVQRVFQKSHQTLDKNRDLESILLRPF